MTNETACSLVPAVPVTRDAIGLLTRSHRRMQRLFLEFERGKDTASAAQQFDVARQACAELLLHMAVEEALFYPAVASIIGDHAFLEDAIAEHEQAKQLVCRIGDAGPEAAAFQQDVTALADVVTRHIGHEEGVVFPRVLLSGLELFRLGEEMQGAINDARVARGLAPEW